MATLAETLAEFKECLEDMSKLAEELSDFTEAPESVPYIDMNELASLVEGSHGTD